MSLHPGVLLGALGFGLLFAMGDSKKEKAKAEPRPGQPAPGGQASIPGVPSIPAPPTAGIEPAVPPAILARMVAVIATGDSAQIRRVAAQLEREGYPRQASELKAAADAIDASAQAGLPLPKAPIKVDKPPPGAVPVKPPAKAKPRPRPRPKPTLPPFVPPEVTNPPGLITIDPITVGLPPGLPTIPIPVSRPPVGAIPIAVPAKPAPPPHPRGAIPDAGTLAGKTALMLWESPRGGPVRDPELLAQYKRSVGLKDLKLYGPGTAKSLMGRGIVPPVPFSWSKRKKKQAKDLHDNYRYKATRDKARAEEWRQAADALKGLF